MRNSIRAGGAERARAFWLQPGIAGFVATLVGFAGAFTVVLTGLAAVGASDGQTASGLLALCLAVGVVAIVLGWRLRMPLGIAWSTPGAALLASAGVPGGGWSAAVGAFVLAALLTLLTGLWRPLRRLVARIPPPIAAAMLAGILLPICVAPAQAVAEIPAQGAPVVIAWLVLLLVAPRWAIPGALAAAGIATAVDGGLSVAGGEILPRPELTLPSFELGALLGLGVPLFVVTMAGQNVAGFAILAGFGYRPPVRPILVGTGLGSLLAAPFGGQGINLAAITAAITASPDADPDPGRRWIAAVAGGGLYLVLGLGAGVAVAVAASVPTLLIECVAGLALLPALATALATAVGEERSREAAVIALAVSLSGVTALHVTAPFWGLVAALVFFAAQGLGSPRDPDRP